ncbi:hypothetical protein ACFVH0_38825 [Streptomyces sp. NPDC127117]
MLLHRVQERRLERPEALPAHLLGVPVLAHQPLGRDDRFLDVRTQ